MKCPSVAEAAELLRKCKEEAEQQVVDAIKIEDNTMYGIGIVAGWDSESFRQCLHIKFTLNGIVYRYKVAADIDRAEFDPKGVCEEIKLKLTLAVSDILLMESTKVLSKMLSDKRNNDPIIQNPVGKALDTVMAGRKLVPPPWKRVESESITRDLDKLDAMIKANSS